jgi:hypothetical protein
MRLSISEIKYSHLIRLKQATRTWFVFFIWMFHSIIRVMSHPMLHLISRLIIGVIVPPMLHPMSRLIIGVIFHPMSHLISRLIIRVVSDSMPS